MGSCTLFEHQHSKSRNNNHQGDCRYRVSPETLDNTNIFEKIKQKYAILFFWYIDSNVFFSGSSSVCWDRYIWQSSEDKRRRKWALPLHEPEGETCWKGMTHIPIYLFRRRDLKYYHGKVLNGHSDKNQYKTKQITLLSPHQISLSLTLGAVEQKLSPLTVSLTPGHDVLETRNPQWHPSVLATAADSEEGKVPSHHALLVYLVISQMSISFMEMEKMGPHIWLTWHEVTNLFLIRIKGVAPKFTQDVT